MRGDSVQDLYAKALALFGLSLLAAIGAVFDYWPVRSTWPAPGSPPGPAPALSLRVRNQPPAVAALPSRTRAASMPRRSTGDAAAEVVAPPAVAPVVMPLAAIPAQPHGTRVMLQLPEEPSPSSPEIGRLVDRVETIAATWTSNSQTPVESLSERTPASETDDDGMFTGAFRKAGSSIVRTGVITGTSIADAARVPVRVLRGVRRAIPLI